MSVLLVITEHASYLTSERIADYERLRRRLERVSGEPVASVPYVELDELGSAGALVLSGSSAPWAMHERIQIDRLGELVRGFGRPVLGICAGMQLQTLFAGGEVGRSEHKDPPGFRPVEVVDDRDLLRGVPVQPMVYTRHSDEVVRLPQTFRVLARSKQCAVEAVAAAGRPWWGTQFHPEEFSTEHPHGERVLTNFFELARGS